MNNLDVKKRGNEPPNRSNVFSLIGTDSITSIERKLSFLDLMLSLNLIVSTIIVLYKCGKRYKFQKI